MRIVMSWLKDYVDLAGVSVEDLAERWTLAGLEVASLTKIGDWWDRSRLVVGAVVRVLPHPNADRLVLADVDYGADRPHRVVTGAPVLVGMRDEGELDRPLKVALAFEGCELFDGHADGWRKAVLKGRKVRGVMSDAMVCSEKELGLSDQHDDILVLDEDAPIGRALADVLGDAVVELDLTPNLARALSVIGVARETAAIMDLDFEAPCPTVDTAQGNIRDLVDVAILDPDLCQRYSARVVRGIRVGPSPGWLARRLSLAGMRPISNVVDITNYVMLEWGEPMHAFDYDALAARSGDGRPMILARRAQPGERMTTLDGVDRALDTDVLLIADEAGPLAIAGVMGGTDTEVGAGTENVLLEAAAFDFISIRRTSNALKLPSESAARFGRGVHPELVAPASARAAELIRRLAGGEVVAGLVDAYPSPPAPVVVDLPRGELERVLGVKIEPDEAARILERLEFEVTRQSDGALRATVPAHRMDVAITADLVEEIARIHGYGRLPSTRMADALPPQRDNDDLRLEELVRDVLAASGLQEIISLRLVSVERETELIAADWSGDTRWVVLSNPISPERSALRTSVLTGLLDAARDNLRFGERVAVFEVGPVFRASDDGLPDEELRVGLLMTGPDTDRSWRNAERRPLDFYDAKGAVETLVAAAGANPEWQPGRHASMHPARTAELQCDGMSVGHVGELHPLVRARWELGDRPVAVADLDLHSLVPGGIAPKRFKAFSQYPPVHEDLAVVVDETVPAAEVAAVIREAAGQLLAGLHLFDLFRGEQVGPGKKSLAWSITLQAPDKTLTNEAATAVRGRVICALEEKLGATIRR